MSGPRSYSVESAREAAARDELDAWVAGFLASPGSDNPALGEQLARAQRWWLGPVRLPIARLHRLAGPAGEPVLVVVDEDDWRDDVEELAEQVDDEGDLPPVVVSYRSGQLVLEDGNHRVEALRRAGVRLAWGVVGFEDRDERDRFEPPADGGTGSAPG